MSEGVDNALLVRGESVVGLRPPVPRTPRGWYAVRPGELGAQGSRARSPEARCTGRATADRTAASDPITRKVFSALVTAV